MSESLSSNPLVTQLRKWHALKGESCFREAADEIERLQRDLRLWMDATNEWLKANGPGGWIDDLRQRATLPPNASPTIRQLETDLNAHIAIEELKNIANAKRADREYFADNTEFAEWAQSRARYTLELIDRHTRESTAVTKAPEPPDAPRFTDYQCDEIIKALETYEFTGFSRDDIRLIVGTAYTYRDTVTKVDRYPEWTCAGCGSPANAASSTSCWCCKKPRTTDETNAVPSGHFWRGEKDRTHCQNCGRSYFAHLHTDEASTCPTESE